MAIALVQNRNSKSFAYGAFALAYNSDVTAGSTLIAIVTIANDADVTISSVQNSNGSDLTLVVGPQRNASVNNTTKWIYYLDNAASGATTLTVNPASFASGDVNLEIFEVSGLDTAGSLIDSSSNSGNTTNPNPGNVDNTVADAFLIAATGAVNNMSALTDWTQIDPASHTYWYDHTQYRIVSSATSWATNSVASSGNWLGVAAAFQASGGGGPATTRGTPFGHRGTAFNGGRAFHGIIQ